MDQEQKASQRAKSKQRAAFPGILVSASGPAPLEK